MHILTLEISICHIECRGFLIHGFRCPPVLIIVFEEKEGGNYLLCEQNKKYILVADGEGTHVRRGRAITNADFEKGGELDGRLDVDIVAVGDEQEALDWEEHIQEKKRDVNGGMYSVVGAGTRVGHSTKEHAVGLLRLRILDLIFTDDPLCAFNEEMSDKRFSLFAYGGKNPHDYKVEPNFDDYQQQKEYQRQRQQEKAAAAAALANIVSIVIVPLCVHLLLDTSNIYIIILHHRNWRMHMSLKAKKMMTSLNLRKKTASLMPSVTSLVLMISPGCRPRKGLPLL